MNATGEAGTALLTDNPILQAPSPTDVLPIQVQLVGLVALGVCALAFVTQISLFVVRIVRATSIFNYVTFCHDSKVWTPDCTRRSRSGQRGAAWERRGEGAMHTQGVVIGVARRRTALLTVPLAHAPHTSLPRRPPPSQSPARASTHRPPGNPYCGLHAPARKDAEPPQERAQPQGAAGGGHVDGPGAERCQGRTLERRPAVRVVSAAACVYQPL